MYALYTLTDVEIFDDAEIIDEAYDRLGDDADLEDVEGFDMLIDDIVAEVRAQRA